MSRTISAILSVYNEEFIIEECINNIKEHVDEIVVVDGSVDGRSNDNTASIVQSYEKVKYFYGTFNSNDAWDSAAQRNHGIINASGDVFLFVSADMVFNDLRLLREAIDNFDDVRCFFSQTIEFWMDSDHIRLYSDATPTTIGGMINQVIAVDRRLNPVYDDASGLQLNTKNPESLLIPELMKFHFGWTRPFSQQIEKHKRHVRQGLWGEVGANLLNGTEQEMDQWAILHVLSYSNVPSIRCMRPKIEGVKRMIEMKYTDGQEDVISKYKSKYNASPFKGVARHRG